MDREVKLSNLDAELSSFDFPVGREAVVDATGEVTLLLADGTANLGALLAESPVERFDSPEDLRTALMNQLPRRAVGEPYQSEGGACRCRCAGRRSQPRASPRYAGVGPGGCRGS